MAEDPKSSAGRGGLRIDSDVFQRLVEEQLRVTIEEGRKPSYSDMLRRLFEVYDASRAEQPSGPHLIASHRGDPRKRRMFELLELIIESGTAHRIAIENNLEMLAFALVATRGRQPEEIRGLLDSMLNAQRLEQEEAASKEPNGGTNHKYGT